MTESTIEQLISELERCAGDYRRKEQELKDKFASLQTENEVLSHNEYNHMLLIEKIYDVLGLKDYTQSCIPHIESLLAELTDLRETVFYLRERGEG